MSKELCIDSDNNIKWVWITDSDRFKKICIIVNEEIFSILSDQKTTIQEVRSIVNDILKGKIDYQEEDKRHWFLSDYYSRDKNKNKTIR